MRRSNGFTLIELMVVISIIVVLTGIAAVKYAAHVRLAREAVLRQDLKLLRENIQEFTEHKRRAPHTLQELVSEDYVFEIPLDPFTKQRDWMIEEEPAGREVDPNNPGIRNIRSSSQQLSSEGTPYSSW